MSHFIWNIDPVLIAIGPLTIHWYGALFASAIFAGLYFMKWIFIQEKQPVESLDNLLMYAVIGIIIGARLGHCLFYDPSYYLSNPLKILAIWEGGLASHGGGLGVIIAVYFYCQRYQQNFLWLLDRLAITTALFGIFVRSANFVNSEIIGKVTDVSWAVVFERIDNLPRHPAQLYEAFAYLTIFITLTLVYRASTAKNYRGMLLGLFLIMTFTARFIIEFFKQQQAAYSIEVSLNTGQLLSIPFFMIGLWLVFSSAKRVNQQVNKG
ncbi:MAG: prolipoprotein diacylglyceryl transferase [Thalassotalea sp.]